MNKVDKAFLVGSIIFFCNLLSKNEMMRMDDSIFREYDIRGKVGTELIIDQVYNLTRALAYYYKEKNPQIKTIAVGMDGRTHSSAIKDEMCRGFADSGMDVIFIGIIPTPALYFALHTLPVDGGVMITASHNPKEYNGMKPCLGKESIWGRQIEVIRDLYKNNKHIQTNIIGTINQYLIADAYADWLAEHFKHLKGMKLSVVIDCANGTAGTVFPQLIQKMNWQNVKLLYPEVDGTYPNHEADPVIEKNMMRVKELLETTDFEVGLGLDGDCDRMAPMTKNGELVAGDKLLAIYAKDVLENHPGAAIVFDIKSSSGLIELLHKWGAKICISPSGHAIVKDQMKRNNAFLGGELSCHFFFNDRYFGYDDGIYSALRLFELLVKTGKTLDELVSIFPHKISSPEYRIDYNQAKKTEIVNALKKAFQARNDAQVITIDGIRATTSYGWGIVRASNTQPKLCLRFESDSQEGLTQIKNDFVHVLKPYFDIESLKNQLN